MRCTSIGMQPAPCAPSTIKRIPLFFASVPISKSGILPPVTFDAAVTTISFVFGRIVFSISAAVISPSRSARMTDCSIPLFSSVLSGRSTELCSMLVVIT